MPPSTSATSAPLYDGPPPTHAGDPILSGLAAFAFAASTIGVIYAISEVVVLFYIAALPLVYFYAVQTCPALESFDAKRELKRVMRGADDPADKPRGLIRNRLNRLGANITTEVASAFGYEVTLYNFLGAANVAAFRVPALETDYFWVGCFGRWTYMGCREIGLEAAGQLKSD